ncbi:hypothetical protein TVAG_450340 [Trichomonas vaginalis G3]|uniref:Uncharacterized protein n=1 Tax=Trichomonas vaginalis (strain ATCC PRA-98 / G3) TaxID=412133 RepID=A2G957_TRIV3|nr:hypothetical protein TVAG_450340 [Trichomonas vaginalis G3]|eukprot:XP_001299245.1 hypothetical protein [Trichomonas vaginalis G3]
MKKDAHLSEEERELKKKRVESLAKEIEVELCRTIRGKYVSGIIAKLVAEIFGKAIKIPKEFAHKMMIDYTWGRYCSADAASFYARLMAERIIEKYQNYPDLQEKAVPKLEKVEEEPVPARNENEDNQKTEEKIPETNQEKLNKEKEEKLQEMKESMEQADKDGCAEVKEHSESISSSEEKEQNKYCDCAVQTILTGEIIEQLMKTQNRFFLQ